jgi:hypothetical protein
MGPIIILDKSALQALSSDEIGILRKHYLPVIPPVLIYEVLGDLHKYKQKGKEEEFIVHAANKLSTHEVKINVNRKKLCLGDLLGYPVTMERIPIVEGGTEITASNGERGVFFDEPEEMKMIRNWQQGQWTVLEEKLSQEWRTITKSFNLQDWRDRLIAINERLPSLVNLGEVGQFVHSLVSDPKAQDFYLEVLLDEVPVSPQNRVLIMTRWKSGGYSMLSEFAPYAFHCLWVHLFFLCGLASKLISPKPTNALDMEYLYYSPFCMVFTSGDNFLKEIAPYFLSPNQDFIEAKVLKDDLKQISEHWNGLTKEQKREYSYEYGGYPPQDTSSITHQLWLKNMLPWKPGSGKLRLTEEQEKRLMEQMRPMIDAIKKHQNKK